MYLFRSRSQFAESLLQVFKNSHLTKLRVINILWELTNDKSVLVQLRNVNIVQIVLKIQFTS